MNNNGFGSSPIRTYKKQSGPNGLRTVLVLLMTAVIIAAVVIFVMSMTGTGMFADKKGGGPAVTTTEDAPETTPPESTTPEQSTTPGDIVDPNGVRYTFIKKTSAAIGKGDLLLINTDNLYKFTEEDMLEEIYKVSPYFEVNDSGFELKYSTVAQLKLLAEGYYNEVSGAYKLLLMDAYRTFDKQNGYHQSNPNGAVPAGASDYHSGATINLKSWNTQEGKVQALSTDNGSGWLKQHAYEYGFIFRSPASKESIVGFSIDWQLRYVGVPHAEYMFINNLCLEEYLTKLSTDHRFSTDGSNALTIECVDGNTYQVYYVEGTTEEGVDINVAVPSNRRYTISGDNITGFIVTVVVEEAVAN